MLSNIHKPFWQQQHAPIHLGRRLEDEGEPRLVPGQCVVDDAGEDLLARPQHLGLLDARRQRQDALRKEKEIRLSVKFVKIISGSLCVLITGLHLRGTTHNKERTSVPWSYLGRRSRAAGGSLPC